jgi:hypothetical protein
MSLEQIIKDRLAAATKQMTESTQPVVAEKKEAEEVTANAPTETAEDKGVEDKVSVDTKAKKPVKESTESSATVSSQVSALLEAEGLSDEFKTQAVTIFEAAVTDRVLSIQEEMQKEFDDQLAEAKEKLNSDIDEFLSEAVAQWQKDNEVAIKTNFNTQVTESFMDGLRSLIAEHNIEVPEGKEDALATALTEVEALKESVKEQETAQAALHEQIKQFESKALLESFRSKMTVVEYDRFVQLTESIKFETADQYEKQLTIVLENFGSTAPKKAAKPVTEEVVEVAVEDKTVAESTKLAPNMAMYVNALKTGAR